MLFHIAEALIMFTWRFVLLPGWLAAAVMTGAMAVNTLPSSGCSCASAHPTAAAVVPR